MKSPTHRPGLAILVGGGIAATLDLTYAVLRNWGNGSPPIRTLHSVASGWLGKAAFESGTSGALVGIGSHYAIVLIAATLYVFASMRVGALRTRPLICGSIFGVLVYLFMNFVVLPLSAVPFKLTYPLMRLIEGFAVHAFFVGVPIACAAYLWALPKTPRSSDSAS